MRKDSFDIDAYDEWLNSEDVDLETKQECQVLDGYFQTRDNLPGKTIDGKELVADPKSTQEIVNDLADMIELSGPVVVKYMQLHDFTFTTIADGSLKWAIWRDITPIQL